MKAMIIKRFGKAKELTIADMPVPSLKPDQVLIRNYYTSVNPMDTQVRAGRFQLFAGRKFPKILGVESAGIIEQVGKNVTAFKKGDRVMGALGFKFGTYADYTAASEKLVFPLPDAVTFQDGATLTMAACTAYNSLHKIGKIRKGDVVLINGAYGGIGSFAVQLAKLAGARVTGVCSTENLIKVKALGADTVIDYTKQDVYEAGKQYDIVFDAVGKLDAGKVKAMLNQGGKMITTVGSFKLILFSIFTNAFSSKTFKSVWNSPDTAQMSLLTSLVAEKKLKPVIDREYNLTELRDAHSYSETGKAKGKILIKILNEPVTLATNNS
jgi:2-desacetyl-2-hydroxyethyl bacteriochlorophyllide A dehydrogenase